jgi:hypothetical protein
MNSNNIWDKLIEKCKKIGIKPPKYLPGASIRWGRKCL